MEERERPPDTLIRGDDILRLASDHDLGGLFDDGHFDAQPDSAVVADTDAFKKYELSPPVVPKLFAWEHRART